MKASRLTVNDTKGRPVLKIDEYGKIACGRFPDATESEKQQILKLCQSMMQDDPEEEQKVKLEKIRQFIYFESDEDEFCS